MPSYIRSVPAILMIIFLGTGCGSHSGKSFVPHIPGYSEKVKKEFVLDKNLLEISGLAYIGGNRVAAVNDEKGELFILDLVADTIAKYKFAGKSDYEDVVKTDSAFFVLDSNGDLYELQLPGTGNTRYKMEIKGKIEFESLVWYKKLNKLVLISKEQRKKSRYISAYSFDLATRRFDPAPFFEIPFKEVFIKLENYNAECKPSAAAINPVNNKLYIVASVGKILMQCTPEGVLEKIYKLNPSHFPQPEGITFADNGDMYISNEGLEGKATILKFPYVAPE